MKALIASDIHDNTSWQEFLLEECAQKAIDLLILPGDMVQAKKECGILEQIIRFRAWVKKVQKQGTSIIACCGNHDHNIEHLGGVKHATEEELDQLFPHPNQAEDKEIHRILANNEWINELESPTFQPPGTTRTYGDLLITSLKYSMALGPEGTKRNIAAVHEAIHNRQGKLWIIVHHVPPDVEKLSHPSISSRYLTNTILYQEPDIVFCGHFHRGPLQHMQCVTQLHKTAVFNSGQFDDGITPCHLLFDTEKKEILWHRTLPFPTLQPVEWKINS